MNYDIVVTSYGALKNDIDDYKQIKFLYTFIDEAQHIKNPKTINANTVKTVNSRCCYAITGTPIENSLVELWSIFDFIMPGYLYNYEDFKKNYEEPIVIDRDKNKLDILSKLISPFILRRMKKDVLEELPDKIERNFIIQMNDEQKKLYAAYFKKAKNELIFEDNNFSKNKIEIIALLTRLRQICSHPSTFIEGYNHGSGKLDQAIEIINNSIDSGHSIILFSQFTRTLFLIREELEKLNINYYYLDGKMRPEERLMVIDNFNSDIESVFLISLKAGGTGLNLTKADIVIHFDPWWNPAVEEQASDRAHRIGQKNVVQVYKLITEGTIEEKMLDLQERKRI